MKARGDALRSVLTLQRIGAVWALRGTLIGVALVGTVACQGGTGTGGLFGASGGAASPPSGPMDLVYSTPDVPSETPLLTCVPDPCLVAAAGHMKGSLRDAEVELGEYEGDERVAELAARWPAVVGDALEQLVLVTGLSFAPEATPRVVLRRFHDESVDWTIEAEVTEGRRRPIVGVNVEPLAAGRRDPTRVLSAALAAAVFEDRALSRTAAPPWLVRMAAIVGGGDFDRRLLALKRRLVSEGRGPRVAPDDPDAAEETALAAILALLESGDPKGLSRFLEFAADGDDPNELLATKLRDPTGKWAGTGRTLLAARLEPIDLAPWERLTDARVALAEEGRGGMEAVLAGVDVSPEIAPEIAVLRAHALLDEGRYEDARVALRGLDSRAMSVLDEPAAAALLHLTAERGSGGDAQRAARMSERIRLDYPNAWKTARERGEVSDEGISSNGAARLPASLVETERAIRGLLREYRAGAARRALEALGERAGAPELESLTRDVAEAEARPSAAARTVNANRVAAWLAAPSPATARDVRDGGVAAADALGPRLPPYGPRRTDGLRLLVDAGGAGRTVRLLAPGWRRHPRSVASDLDTLLRFVIFTELRVWVDGVAPDAVARVGGAAFWDIRRFGLDADWAREHGAVLRDLRSDEYSTRREAFRVVRASGRITPEVVAWGLGDPAPLLRRGAVRAGGEQAFVSLVRVALRDDEAWVVRQAACQAMELALGAGAARDLVAVLNEDPVPQVRHAAARVLLTLAEKNPPLMGALVYALRQDDPALRKELIGRLPGLPKPQIIEALVRGLEAEVIGVERPDAATVSRLFLVLRRATGRDPGYVPGMTVPDVRLLVGDLRRTQANELRPPRGGRSGTSMR